MKDWGPKGYGKCNRKQSGGGTPSQRLKRYNTVLAALEETQGMTNPIRSKMWERGKDF